MLRLTAIIAFSLCWLTIVSGTTYKKCFEPYTEHDKRLRLDKKLPFYVKHYDHLAYVVIYCDKGYYLYDSQSRDFVTGNRFKTQCRNGEYDPPVPDKRFSCRKPDPVCILKLNPNVIAKPDKTTFKRGEEVKFGCESGYYLIGIDETICVRDGEFLDKKLPSCAPYCQEPKQKYLVVKSNSKSFRVGGKIGLDCVDGYRLRDDVDQTRYCQLDGEWDGPIEDNLCERVGCPYAPKLVNGRYYPATSSDKPGPDGWFKVGAKLKYECKEEYYLEGKDYMLCARTGKFVFKVPRCIKIICDKPMIPKNGRISKGEKDEYGIGDDVEYKCDFNYYIKGKDSATCKKRGVKEGIFTDAPECIEILCDKPMPIKNGEFSPVEDDYSIGDAVTYTCDKPNYRLVGIKKAICEKVKNKNIAKFSHVPFCEEILCDAPMPIDNGKFVSKPNPPFTLNEVVYYECNRGYEFPTTLTTSTCELQNDKISAKFSKPPMCKRVYCSFPGTPVKGSTSPVKKQYVVDESVTFDCNTCYKLKGDRKSTCQQNGKFDNPVPTCKIIQCSKKDIPYPSDSTFFPLKQVYDCGDVVTFKCHEAFKHYNDEKTTCQENGQWSIDEKAVCKPIICLLPKLNKNVRVTPKRNQYSYGATIKYYCKPGYSVVEDSDKTKAVCQSNGEFSNPSITCKRNKCGPPPVPKFGSVTPDTSQDEYLPGDEIEYECKLWYTFKKGDKPFNLCQNDGTWENDAPTCEPPSCHGQCLSKGEKGRCKCDYKCYERDDCCYDRTDQCKKYSCGGRCGKYVGGGCSCESDCTTSYTKRCCHDYLKACPGAWYRPG